MVSFQDGDDVRVVGGKADGRGERARSTSLRLCYTRLLYVLRHVDEMIEGMYV